MRWLFVRRLRPYVMLAGIASFVLNLALLMPSIYMMQVFDRVFSSSSVETLVMLSGITLLILILSYFLDTVRARALAHAGRSLDRAMGPQALRGSLEQSASGGKRADTDAIRDISQLRGVLHGRAILAVFDAPWLPIYLLVIGLMHPWLGVAATLGAALLAGIGVLTDRLTRDHADNSTRRSRTSAKLVESLARNAEVIVGMGMTQAAIAKWQVRHGEMLSAQQQHSELSIELGAVARALRQVLQVAVLGIGAWLVIDKQASAGVMIAGTILLGRALQPVEHLIGGWRALVDARGAWQRLSERRITDSSDTHVRLPVPTGRLDVERVSFTLSAGRPVLIRNVSLSLAPGESLCITGPSAAGKTTLVRLLLGLWKPQAGVVRLDGADIARWDRDQIGEHVGYLPQDVELFAGTIGENIARLTDVSQLGHSRKIVRAAKAAQAHEMILQMPDGYETQIGEGGAGLSGGQRQRIGLARALFGEPRIIILDEPNANLDAAGEEALLAAIEELKAQRATVIMVTHKPSLMGVLDKVAVVKNGAIEMIGPSAAVLARMRSGDSRVVPFPARTSEMPS